MTLEEFIINHLNFMIVQHQNIIKELNRVKEQLKNK